MASDAPRNDSAATRDALVARVARTESNVERRWATVHDVSRAQFELDQFDQLETKAKTLAESLSAPS